MEIICPNCRRRFDARSRRIVCPFCSASIDAWEVLIGQRGKALASTANHTSHFDETDFLEIPTFLVPERTLSDPDLVLEESYELREGEPERVVTAPPIVASSPPPEPLKEETIELPAIEVESEAQIETTAPIEKVVTEQQPEPVNIEPVASIEPEPAVASAPPEAPVSDFVPPPEVSAPRYRAGRVLAAIAAVAIGAIALYYLLGRSSPFSGASRNGNTAAASLENTPQPAATSPISPEVTPRAESSITAQGALASPTPSATETPVPTPPKIKTTPTPETAPSGDAGNPPPVLPSTAAPPSDENASTRARTVTGSESPGGIFTLQIAARSNEDEAKALADRLIEKGYDARIIKTSGTGKMWYRVRVGMFSSREDAVRYGEQLKQAGTVTEYFVTDRRH